MSAMLDELFELLRQSGATMTFYGRPVTADEIRGIALQSAKDRIYRALIPKDEQRLALARWADDGGKES